MKMWIHRLMFVALVLSIGDLSASPADGAMKVFNKTVSCESGSYDVSITIRPENEGGAATIVGIVVPAGKSDTSSKIAAGHARSWVAFGDTRILVPQSSKVLFIDRGSVVSMVNLPGEFDEKLKWEQMEEWLVDVLDRRADISGYLP